MKGWVIGKKGVSGLFPAVSIFHQMGTEKSESEQIPKDGRFSDSLGNRIKEPNSLKGKGCWGSKSVRRFAV